MADRVSASIELGGTLSVMDYAELCDVIAHERLSTEWDGPLFEPHHRSHGRLLRLHAHDVAWGRFDVLEATCGRLGLPFVRWSGGYSGAFGAERVVFTGRGEPRSYASDEDEQVVIDCETSRRLGSFEAIMAHFDAANFTVPALVVDGDADTTASEPQSEIGRSAT